MEEPKADFEALKKVEAWLVANHSCYFAQKVGEAVAEIERLRAGQFRWIPVSEKWPGRTEFGPNGILCMNASGLVYLEAHYVPAKDVTHWADIPPLPERTQEEKDEEIWRRYAAMDPKFDSLTYRDAKFVFMCGLKAARGEK